MANHSLSINRAIHISREDGSLEDFQRQRVLLDKFDVTVNAFCSTIKERSSIDLTPIALDSDWDANRRYAFIPNRI